MKLSACCRAWIMIISVGWVMLYFANDIFGTRPWYALEELFYRAPF